MELSSINLIELNNRLVALERLSLYYYEKIEQWENTDPAPREGLMFLRERYEQIQMRMVEVYETKSQLGLPL
jgi:hypothetical protein